MLRNQEIIHNLTTKDLLISNLNMLLQLQYVFLCNLLKVKMFFPSSLIVGQTLNRLKICGERTSYIYYHCLKLICTLFKDYIHIAL